MYYSVTHMDIWYAPHFRDTLNKLQLFSRTQRRFILIQIEPLHVCYKFRPVLRPSSGMPILKSYKGCIDMPEGGLSKAETCSWHIGVTNWIKINMCFVGLNTCGLFSNKHNGMASIKIATLNFFPPQISLLESWTHFRHQGRGAAPVTEK